MGSNAGSIGDPRRHGHSRPALRHTQADRLPFALHPFSASERASPRRSLYGHSAPERTLLVADQTELSEIRDATPLGRDQAGEDVEHALKREIWEETNLECTIERFVAILQYEDANTRSTFRTHLFCVRELSGEFRSNDPSEQITDWREAPPGELLDYAAALTRLSRNWANWGLFRAAAIESLSEYCGRAPL